MTVDETACRHSYSFPHRVPSNTQFLCLIVLRVVTHLKLLLLPYIQKLDSRTYLLVDPSEREERVMDGLLVIAMNKHREICTIQSSGGIMLVKDQVSLCLDQSFSLHKLVPVL